MPAETVLTGVVPDQAALLGLLGWLQSLGLEVTEVRRVAGGRGRVMSDELRVEVHVRGCLGGDLLAMVAGLDPRVVPRHTVLTVGTATPVTTWSACCTPLERAGVELERVTT